MNETENSASMSARAARALRTACCAALIGTLPSCYVLEHTIGAGPSGEEVINERQYYIFFGGIRIGEHVDAERLAGDATSYRVRSEWSFKDMLINLLTLPLTITSRTVTVTK